MWRFQLSGQKKEKQNASRDNHYKLLEYINGYIKKLDNILRGQEIIKSNDADAIEKLQEKLAELEKVSGDYEISEYLL